MSLGHCSCPECGTILRIRDRSFVGRNIDCPECHADLLIEVDEHKALFARRAPAEQKPRPAPQLTVAASRVHVALVRRLGDAAKSPLMLAWALAIGVTAFFAILMLRPTVRFLTGPASPQETATTESTQNPAQANEAPPSQEKPMVDNVAPPLDGALSENPLPDAPAIGPMPPPKVTDPPAVTSDPNVAIAPPANTVAQPPNVPASPPVKIDVDALLKQRLVSFKTPKPVMRRLLIETVEEMLGAPIRYDAGELGEKNLDKPVTLELENTTVGGVLKTLLDAAGWEFVIEDNGLRLKPRQVAGPTAP